MRLKSGQKLYRLRGPDGLWIKKAEHPQLEWVANEEVATFWGKLGNLNSARETGALRDDALAVFLDGLPAAAIEVIEYNVTVERTKRTNRLTEIQKFYEEQDDSSH